MLDLTFTNFPLDLSWSVQPIPLGSSHHLPIIINIASTAPKSKLFLSKNKLKESLADLELEPDLEQICLSLETKIKEATHKTSLNRSPKGWWNEKLIKPFRNLKAARKRCHLFPSPDNFEMLMQAQVIWKNAVRTAKRNNWQKKIEELNTCSSSKQAWKFV